MEHAYNGEFARMSSVLKNDLNKAYSETKENGETKLLFDYRR